MIRFGAMGWSYDDWKGPFYTLGARPDRLLAELSGALSAVEIDASFYGLPRASTLAGWANQVTSSPDFRFSAKAPRAITHEKRLIGSAADDARSAAAFLRDGLGEKLAFVLLQMPPDFTASERRHVDRFFDAAGDGGGRWALELRHASWLETDIAASLQERGVALATTEKLDFGHPPRYLRLLGEDGAFARFDQSQIDRGPDLDAWAARIREADMLGGDTFVFARNFYEGHAPATLFYLMERLGIAPPTPPGRQQMSLF